jgi:spore germination cell wall hydrolase CwlJ-like protein
VAGVCRAPFQFPCWNRNHPRHARLRDIPAGDGALAICRRVAARAIAGALPDPTGGATHFHDAAALPGWAIGRPASAEIGGLCFYRAEDLT